uniref:Uncharacterized protein n=1 Tax=Leersia perrieri TaxID=77586 RepID=A0A0D9X8C2_9ORYZ
MAHRHLLAAIAPLLPAATTAAIAASSGAARGAAVLAASSSSSASSLASLGSASATMSVYVSDAVLAAIRVSLSAAARRAVLSEAAPSSSPPFPFLVATDPRASAAQFLASAAATGHGEGGRFVPYSPSDTSSASAPPLALLLVATVPRAPAAKLLSSAAATGHGEGGRVVHYSPWDTSSASAGCIFAAHASGWVMDALAPNPAAGLLGCPKPRALETLPSVLVSTAAAQAMMPWLPIPSDAEGVHADHALLIVILPYSSGISATLIIASPCSPSRPASSMISRCFVANKGMVSTRVRSPWLASRIGLCSVSTPNGYCSFSSATNPEITPASAPATAPATSPYILVTAGDLIKHMNQMTFDPEEEMMFKEAFFRRFKTFRYPLEVGDFLRHQNFDHDGWRYILKSIYRKLGPLKDVFDIQIKQDEDCSEKERAYYDENPLISVVDTKLNLMLQRQAVLEESVKQLVKASEKKTSWGSITLFGRTLCYDEGKD